jgi:phage shock protein E
MRRSILLSLGLLMGMSISMVRAADAALWIDVRAPEEYAAGHLPGAINIPYQHIALEIGRVETHKDRAIKLYCGIGVRAQMAKLSLESQGYQHVSNEGGFANLARTLGSEHGASGCTGRC